MSKENKHFMKCFSLMDMKVNIDNFSSISSASANSVRALVSVMHSAKKASIFF